MLKAKIYNLALFENFLGIINKFVQRCQFELSVDGLGVFCKNPTSFSSARLLLDTNVIKLNEGQDVDSIKICIRDIIAFKTSISIVQQIEEVNNIEIGLEDVHNGDETYIKSINYKSKNGGSFKLITIDFDVIKGFVSKNTDVELKKDWYFNVIPKYLDIAQNRTNGIVNLEEVSVYVYPDPNNGKAIVELSSKTSASINKIAIPISDSSTGSLEKSQYDMPAIHESSFRIFNILKVTEPKDILCSFNIDNNIFLIKSHLNIDDININSRLFIQMVKGK